MQPKSAQNKGRFKKGSIPWNKGTKGMGIMKPNSGSFQKGNKNWLGKHHSKKSKDKNKKTHLGKKMGKKTREKNSYNREMEWKLGKRKGSPCSIKHRKKLSKANKGEKSHNWKGGINPINDTIRKSIEVRLWREAVFARDNWTCQKYGIRGGKLHAHHIQNFAQFPELRFAIDNGITFSEKAHREFHKKYGVKNNIPKQLKEFLL